MTNAPTRTSSRGNRASEATKAFPISNNRMLPCMRARLYSARRASVSSSEARKKGSSSASGLRTRGDFASPVAVNGIGRVSESPSPTSTSRTRRPARCSGWSGVLPGRDGRISSGSASNPIRRATSSIRSTSNSRSCRHDGGMTVNASSASVTVHPSDVSRRTISDTGTYTPSTRAMRAGRNATGADSCASAPTMSNVSTCPPETCAISAAPIRAISRTAAGSTPRSKR